MVTSHRGSAGPGRERRSHTHPMGNHRGQLPPSRCQPLPACARTKGQAGGLIRLSGRIPAAGDTQSIILSPGQRPSPADLGKAGCSYAPGPRPPPAGHPAQKGPPA